VMILVPTTDCAGCLLTLLGVYLPVCVLLQVYKLYSELISKAIAEGGPHAARSQVVKYMRRWVGSTAVCRPHTALCPKSIVVVWM
jgi:hypothetical protein